MAYRIDLSPDAQSHLRRLTACQQATVVEAIDEQLAQQPTVETRNRKPMRPNPLAPWELRVGQFRVYYDIQEDPEPVVLIRAIGIKTRNRVTVGGKEVNL